MSTAALPRVKAVVARHRGAVPLVAGQRAVAECRRAGADERGDITAPPRHPPMVNRLAEGFDGRLTAFLPSAGARPGP